MLGGKISHGIGGRVCRLKMNSTDRNCRIFSSQFPGRTRRDMSNLLPLPFPHRRAAASGFKREVTIDMLLGGGGRVTRRGGGGGTVVNDVPCASRSACWRSLQGWMFGRAAPRRRLRQRAVAKMAGGGNDDALAATRAGVGRRDDRGRGLSEIASCAACASMA
jgi:hypothetical protein